MNDSQISTQAEASLQAGGDESITAGAMLRRAREAAGLHVAALAVSMKIPVKKLEALEADKLDLLLDAVFVRALASSVCRTLKIDPAPVLEKLPQNRVPRLKTDAIGINAPFHAPGQNPGVFLPAYFAKPVFLVVLILLVGVAALVFFPELPSSTPTPIAELAPVEPPPMPQPVEPEVPVGATATASAEVVVAATPDAAVTMPPVGQIAPEAPEVPKNPTTAPPMDSKPAIERPVATIANAPVAAGLVAFKANASSWVEVIDSKGVVQLRRTLAAGESASAGGTPPLAVIVGRADALEVQVRGKAFDFPGVSKDGVARFEVK